MRDLIINPQLTIPAAELRISFARAGGPGGQHVNKTESKVVVRWNLRDSAVLTARDAAWLGQRLRSQITADGDLMVVSSKTRDQSKNRADALDKMEAIIRVAMERPKARRATKPTRGSVERRLREKKQTSERKRGRRQRPDEH